MKIFLLTPIYATTTQGSGTTPVVHYFAKEWVAQGHEVHVINLRARFPRIFYWISRRFQHWLNSRLGMLVHLNYPKDHDYVADGVDIHCRTMRKLIPHSEYSHSKIMRTVDMISKFCDVYGTPDVFIGHWHNPQLEVLAELKKKYGIKTCLVLHENRFTMHEIYKDRLLTLLSNIDVIGFRNPTAKADYINRYGMPKSSFIAYSGVSTQFLEAGANSSPSFENGVKDFAFVGSLIARKHPAEIVKALDSVYNEEHYSMKYIGDGAEKANIEAAIKPSSNGDIIFTGRITREDIIEQLKSSQVFVMISRHEIFGLVYLEAMALGLIPIGSKNEGIDGIIKDGENGFLCEAGNHTELANIISRIKSMPKSELERISRNAKQTAREYSDKAVAKQYLENVNLLGN